MPQNNPYPDKPYMPPGEIVPTQDNPMPPPVPQPMPMVRGDAELESDRCQVDPRTGKLMTDMRRGG